MKIKGLLSIALSGLFFLPLLWMVSASLQSPGLIPSRGLDILP